MIKYEIALALLSNLQCLAWSALIIGGIVFLVLIFVGWANADCDESKEKIKKLYFPKIKYFVLLGMFVSLPSPQNIWKIRINLLELELSSTENVKATTEHIEKLAQALECKYLEECPERK